MASLNGKKTGVGVWERRLIGRWLPPKNCGFFLRGLWSFLFFFDFWSPKFTVPAGENLPVGYLLFDRYACLDRYC